MTVIAYRDGLLAADSGVFHGDYSITTQRKITRFPDGSLYAPSGLFVVGQMVRDWLVTGAHRDDRPAAVEEEEDFGALWLRKDGLWRINKEMRPYLDDAPFAAEGSHCEFVFGAMANGATAEEAVRLACRYGAWARGPVVVERL